MIWFTNPEVTVACVYRSGGPYGPDDVRILRNQVQRNLTVPHEFVCISDETVAGVSCIPMAYGLPGKWSKMELWRPYIPWTGSRILYLDLDAVIQNHIDSLIKKAPVTFRQPSPEYKTRRTEEGLQRIRRYSSAVMCIEPHSRPEVWDNFENETMGYYMGDQDYLGDVIPGEALFSEYEAFKFQPLQHQHSRPKAKVVVFGHPHYPQNYMDHIWWIRECRR